MGNWRKLLERMVNDTRPVGYTYDDVARVLQNLGFGVVSGATRHRTWKLVVTTATGKRTIVIGLLAGPGPLKPEYVKTAVAVLRTHGLIPTETDL